MPRLAWLTDLHVNFLDAGQLEAFLAELARCGADAFAITGDITEASELIRVLRRFAERLERPIYFVLGNHDYYFSSIEQVRRQVAELCRQLPQLVWLTAVGVVPLSRRTAILGHDGWADGRLGDYERSLVSMQDWRLIDELRGQTKMQRWATLKQLADEGAAHVRRWLPEALADFDEVLLLTHVPPFRESCWYEGRISDDHWLPHFTSQAMGQAILEVAAEFPQRRLTVLCGHTHSPGSYAPTENVTVLTGGATYGQPSVQQVFELP